MGAVLGLSGLLAYSFYRGRKKENKINAVLKKQKKEITDSIRYARNIQESVLLGEQEAKKILGL